MRAQELLFSELEKLAPGDHDTQIQIVEKSIQNGWKGVFPLKGEKPAGGYGRREVTNDALLDQMRRVQLDD